MRRPTVVVIALLAAVCAFLGPLRASPTEVTFSAPYPHTEVCYKVTWPPGTECYDRYVPASSGVLAVGGTKVVGVGSQTVMPPHVSKMGLGAHLDVGRPGTLHVRVELAALHVANALADQSVICLTAALAETCSADPVSSELSLTTRVTDTSVLLKVTLLKPYAGASAAIVRAIHATFVPDETTGVEP